VNATSCVSNYEKNGFRYLIADERLEAKYMGIGAQSEKPVENQYHLAA
jgi:hypothetical protein